MKIRAAKQSDKEEILSFCSNTFSWGDYIDQVWDFWQANRNGRLLVAESQGKKIAVSHVALCPGKRRVWLEGIRVRPDHRRSQVATKLIEKMLQYGRQRGAHQASAIVAAGNVASQRMMEKNGFAVISRWVYYSTSGRVKQQKSGARFATAREIDSVWLYLKASEAYRLSAKTYVKAWHWYTLDRRALQNFIKEQRVVVTGMPVDGVAIVNKAGYWTRKNVLQVVYLDSAFANSLKHLMSFATNMYAAGKFERLQIICHDSKSMTSNIQKFMKEESERFLLYSRLLR